MKTSTPFILLFSLMLLGLSACSEQVGPTPEEIQQAWNNTPGKISPEQCNQLEEHYKDILYQDSLVSTNDTSYADYREVWFDIEDLKNYIQYVEQHAKEKNYSNLGIRVYFGATNVNSGMPRSTVFFYGTGRFAGTSNLQQDEGGVTEPNLPGIDGLNMGNSGMPPSEFKYP